MKPTTPAKRAGPKTAIRKAKPPIVSARCSEGHPIAAPGDPCEPCDRALAKITAEIGPPPQDMVIRDGTGKTTYFRIPKHLRPRRATPRRTGKP